MMLARNVVRNVLRSTIRDVVRGGGSDGPTNVFSPLKNSLLNTLNGHSNTGLVQPVFGDAANDRYTPDCFGKWNGMLPEEQPQEGQRRVRNLVPFSNDFTQTGWSLTGAGSVTENSDSTWTLSESATGAGENLRFTHTPSSLSVGEKFVYTIELKDYTGDSTLSIYLGEYTGSTFRAESSVNVTSSVTGKLKRFVVTRTVTNALSDNLKVDIRINVGSTTLATVKVTKAQFENTSGQPDTTTPGEYVSTGVGTGEELVTNGDFDTDSDWTKGTGWSIGSGVATKTAGTASELTQPISITPGKTYLVEYTATISAGQIQSRLSDGGSAPFSVSTAHTTTGTYKDVLVSQAGQDQLEFVTSSSSALTLDNVSVKEIDHGANVDGVKNFATVNRNQVLNNVVSIAPEPKTELVTNGADPEDTDGWTAYDSGVLTVDGGKFDLENGAAITGKFFQQIATIPGRRYRLQFDFTRVDTNATLLLGTTQGGTQIYTKGYTASDSVDLNFIAPGNSAYIVFRNDDGTATRSSQWNNISLKEISTELNIVKTRPNHLVTNNVNGNFASTQDTAVNSPTADITIIWYGTLADWTPADPETLVSKYDPTGNNRCWDMYVVAGGVLRILTSTDGTATLSYDCPTNPSTVFPDGTGGWLKCDFYTNVNSTSYAVFSYSNDPYTEEKDPVINWTELDTTATKGNTSLYDGNAVVSIGQHATGDNSNGTHYRGIVYSGITLEPGEAGKESITNGFDLVNTDNWTPLNGTILSVDDGKLVCTGSGASAQKASQGFTTVPGATYVLSYDAFAGTVGNGQITIGTSEGAFDITFDNSVSAAANKDIVFVAKTATTYLGLGIASGTATSGSFKYNNISVKRVDPAVKIADWNPGLDADFRTPKTVTSKYGFGALDGTGGTHFSSPDGVAIVGTTQIFEADVQVADYTPAARITLGGQYDYGANQRSWSINIEATTGYISFIYSLNGGVGIQDDSAAPSLKDGQRYKIRVVRNSVTGTLDFYHKAHGSDIFTKIGQTVNGTAGTLHNSTANITVGCNLNSGSATNLWVGKAFSLSVKYGVDDVPVFEFNPERDFISGSTMTSRSMSKEVWTANSNAKYSYTWNVNGAAYLTSDETNIYYLEPTGYLGEAALQETTGYANDIATGWTNVTTASATKNAIGVDGRPNTAFTITDASAVNVDQRRGSFTVANDSVTRYVHFRVKWVADTSSNYPYFSIAYSGGTGKTQSIVFDRTSGTYTQPNTDGTVLVYRVGEWWSIVLGLTNNSTGNTTCFLSIAPAWNTTGATGLNNAAQGSITVATAEFSVSAWSYSPIFSTGGVADTRPATIEPTIDFDWDKVDAEGSLTIKASPKFTGTPLANWGILTVTAAADNVSYFSQTSGTRLGSFDGTTGVAIQGAWGYVGENIEIRITWGDGFFQYSAVRENGAILLSANTAYDGSWNPAADVITLLKSLGLACAVSRLEAWPVKRDLAWLQKRAA